MWHHPSEFASIDLGARAHLLAMCPGVGRNRQFEPSVLPDYLFDFSMVSLCEASKPGAAHVFVLSPSIPTN